MERHFVHIEGSAFKNCTDVLTPFELNNMVSVDVDVGDKSHLELEIFRLTRQEYHLSDLMR